MPSLKRLLVVFICMFASGPYALAQAQSLACVQRKPIDGLFFGMHIHRFHDPRMMPTVSFGSWRLWDAGVSWQQLQPSRDTWDFRRLDLAMAIAQQRHVELGLVLGMTPAWAAARPTENSFAGAGAASEPRDFADWDNYVRTVVSRYKGRIQFYEIWNEPNTAGFFTGSVPQMVELARRAYQIVKTIDPAATVVSPSSSHTAGLPWFTQYAAAGGLTYADVVGYHFYVDSKVPEDIVPLVRSVRGVINGQAQGNAKPLWNTESGVSNDGTPNTGLQVGPAAQLSRQLVLGACLGLQRFEYYAWDNGDLGLFDPVTLRLRQQASTFAQVEKWLVGASVESCEIGPTLSRCVINRQNGRYTMLWASSAATLGDVGGFQHAEDSFGSSLSLPPASLPLGAAPILVW
jgi:hypothetical protein